MLIFESGVKTFFCNQKIRFLLLWLFACLFFFLFASLGRLKDLGEYVTLSVCIPVILYIVIIYEITQRGKLKYRKAKESIHLALTDLAKKENPKIKAVVVKELPGKVAYSLQKEKIVLSSALFNGDFSEQEIKALLHHEICHTKTGKYDWFFLIPFIPLWIGVLGMFLFLQFFPLYFLFLAGGLLSGLYMILFERMRWLSEFKADEYASRKVGFEVFISALMKTASSKRGDCDTPTHPSVNRRISRAKKVRIT